MYLSHADSFYLWSAARRQRRVLNALMLRYIRTRFFGNGLGYLVGSLGRCHISWFSSGYLLFMGRATPYGDSTVLFVATGVVPFMTSSYLARL